jgi:drug/metabolite transporter (DMT)-like permease
VTARPPTILFVAAFAAIYLIWGSTYLGIKVAIEDLPALFMAGSRFALAGLLMLGWLLAAGRVALPDLGRRRLMLSAAVGVLMLGMGNGLVVWSIQHGAATGIVAVLIALTPFWLVGIERLVEPTRRITLSIVAGLLVGVVGIVVLTGAFEGGSGNGGAAVPMWTLGVMLVATLSWACGSMLSRYGSGWVGGSADPLLAPSLQMLGGGGALLVASAAMEQWSVIDLSKIGWKSWTGYLYLIVFGSIVAYTAFIWLLRNVSAAAVGTYAFVNPVVAVLLGALFLDEPLTLRAGIASALILAAVMLIHWSRWGGGGGAGRT